jgi:hypothetical protein
MEEEPSEMDQAASGTTSRAMFFQGLYRDDLK